MGDVIKFETDSPHGWTVEDALERALQQVRSGKFEADAVYVAMCKSGKEGSHHGEILYTMAGMQLVEAIGWLTMHKQVLMSGGD